MACGWHRWKHIGDCIEAAELVVLEQAGVEKITFGVDSGAAITVISEIVATDYPRCSGPVRVRDCQGRHVEDLGVHDLQLKSRAAMGFAGVSVA